MLNAFTIYTISITISIYSSIITICKKTVKDSGIDYLPLNYILMIASDLIQDIVDLTVRIFGDEPSKTEMASLNDSTIEDLTAKREDLLIQLAF